MAVKIPFLLAVAIAQADDAPIMLNCIPESVEMTNEGTRSSWSCRERATSCEERSFDLAAFERSGADHVQSYTGREEGITAESVVRIRADASFEENVQWIDASGRTTFRQVTRGRCERGRAEP